MNLDAAFAVLEPHERAAVLGFARTLGLGDWAACPPLKRVTQAVAVRRLAGRLAADMPDLSRTAALRQATWALGAGPKSGSVAASIDRARRRWAAR